MFKDFIHRQSPCNVNGEPDKVILSRETKATTVLGKEYMYNGLFATKSPVLPGNVVQKDMTFLVQTLRFTATKDKYCSLIKTNVTVEVQRYMQEYDANDNPKGKPEFTPVAAEIVGFAQRVSAQLKQEEPGLLPTTSLILLLQTDVDVREPSDPALMSPDRILISGKKYQVDVVDRIKYPNLLYIQLCEDRR
ncbi:hypothetical protein QP794_01630 [Paenibacillus sp. UMB7766-LJ446]|uniref:hypothetical protein n=1 Tax=Paenibacillus sp. UMB7766-LJ446 TaxID=3046313 RepID=UPI00254EFB3D|nr:hypothetical protein [Paenibacillus sp. UMB7766-LJ446]MDK8188782.1 hypothetical protein [Paenibacillus sp. UMB7766-LJ446]